MIDRWVEFLTKCLDEDESAARDLARAYRGPWSVLDCMVLDAGGDTVVYDEYHWGPLPHIARHDPARVLREVEAKRNLIAVAETAYYAADHYASDGILRSLAAVYSDHPDYPKDDDGDG
jgi:hypothetical protein